MVDTKRHPTYILNKYIWELLKANIGMTEMDYADPVDSPSGRTPIVPANQEPEFAALNKPFLVYGYSEDSTAVDYTCSYGSLSYAVWSTNIGEINNILNIIRAALERRDESAADINRWSSRVANYVGIRFGSTYIGYQEGPSPEDSEGGRQAGIITVRYEYFAEYDFILPTGAARG